MSRRNARHRRPSPITSALRSPTRLAVGATSVALVAAGALAAVWTGAPASPGVPQTRAFSTLGAYAYQGKPGRRPAAAASASTVASPTVSRVRQSGTPATRAAAPAPVDPTATSPAPSAASSRTSTPTPAPTPGGASASPSASPASPTPTTPAASGYRNPFRDVSGLIPERVDQGVDFGGAGAVYALGDGVVTNATAGNSGWPGGGWITYKLTDGPAAGLTVFLAEDVTPAVQVGQQVTSSTVIGHMFDGGDGIETGWAMASGLSAESQLPEAGGIGGNGPFPTKVGVDFENLLVSLGVPASPNRDATSYGLLPSAYPASW